MSRGFLSTNAGLEGPLHTLVETLDILEDSPFAYRGWLTIPNFHLDRREFAPINTVAFGSVVRFTLDKRRDKLGPIQLRWTLPALTATGTATFARYVDFAAYHIIRNLEVRHGANVLFQISGREIHRIYHRLDKNPWMAMAHEALLLAGGLSAATRNTLAAGTQTVWTPLDDILWFTDASKYFDVAAVSQEVQINITLATLAQIVQTDDTIPTAAAGVLDVQMKPLNIFVEDDERDQHIRRTLTSSGLVMQFEEITAQENNILNTTAATQQIRLDSLRGLVKELVFVVRVQSDTDTTFPDNQNNRPNRFIQIQSFRILSNSEILVDTVRDEYCRGYLGPLYHSADFAAGELVYFWSWSLQPEDQLNSLGHIDFSGLANPILEITFAAVPAVVQEVDVYARRLNTLQMAKGEIIKTFN